MQRVECQLVLLSGMMDTALGLSYVSHFRLGGQLEFDAVGGLKTSSMRVLDRAGAEYLELSHTLPVSGWWA